jgi:hypothetical protein
MRTNVGMGGGRRNENGCKEGRRKKRVIGRDARSFFLFFVCF